MDTVSKRRCTSLRFIWFSVLTPMRQLTVWYDRPPSWRANSLTRKAMVASSYILPRSMQLYTGRVLRSSLRRWGLQGRVPADDVADAADFGRG